MPRSRLAWLVVLLASCALSTASATNGPITFILGPKGPVSLPSNGDGWSMFRMPSGIAWNLDSRIDLHVFAFQGEIAVKNNLNDFEASTFSPAGSFGFVIAPGREAIDSDEDAPEVSKGALQRFTFGFGIYPDMAGGGNENDVRLTTFPQTVGLSKGIRFITGAFQVSYRPTEWLAFGLGLHAIYASLDTFTLVGGGDTPLNGSPTINGVALPGNPSYADFLDLFASDGASDPTTIFETELNTVQFSGVISVSLKPVDWFSIGISYRPRSWDPIGFEGDAKIDATTTFSNAIGTLDPVLRDLFLSTLPNGGNDGFVGNYDVTLGGLRIPRQIRMSMMVRPHDRVLLGAELAWTEWHRAFRGNSVRLRNGDNTDLNFVIGSTSIDSAPKTRWRNNWTLSLYSAIAVTDDLTLRFGAAFRRNPFNPDRQGGTPTSGFAGPMVSVGAGYWLGNWEISALIEHSFHESNHSRRDQGLTANGSYYSDKQWFLHGGVSYLF